MSKIKTGLSRLNAVQLVSKAQDIVDAMTDNTNFPTPTPALASITAKIEMLETAIRKAQWRDKRFMAARNEQMVELKKMLMTLSEYVSITAQGDREVILSSGFGVAKEPEPITELRQPKNLGTILCKQEGRVKLNWDSVPGALNYLVDMTTTNPASGEASWSVAGYTSKSRFQIDNLPSGVKYWFRVRALGTRDESAYSDPALGMAI
jgi:hypothetical protein